MNADAEDVDTSGMARKLEAYNHVFDQEMATLRDGGGSNKRRQQQFLHCESQEEEESLHFFLLLPDLFDV